MTELDSFNCSIGATEMVEDFRDAATVLLQQSIA